MSTYTQVLYQIVFSTKNRENVLLKENRTRMYNYIAKILMNNKCFVYKINGVENHIHIASSIHQSKSLSNVVADIKRSSSVWIKNERLFPEFSEWQVGYGAFTYSIKEKDYLVKYINNQETHHKTITFREEFIGLLKEFEVKFEEKYLL